jgi:hypothetical protein
VMKRNFTGSGQVVEDIAPLLLSRSLRRERWRVSTTLPGRLPSVPRFLTPAARARAGSLSTAVGRACR